MAENTQEQTEKRDQEEVLNEMADNQTEETVNEDADNSEQEGADSTSETVGEVVNNETKLAGEVAELKDKYLRLYADFENFRRRTSKEKLELIGTANADLVRNLLPVVDDFERATQSFEASNDLEALREGVNLIYQKLFKTLESIGVKPMNATGKDFDADIHESVAQFPAPSEDMKGKVVDEIEKGYFLNDKVVRYAKVVVGQ